MFDSIDLISLTASLMLILLTWLMPSTEEKMYVFTNIIFFFPSVRAFSYKMYDISIMFFTLIIASGGWHYYKTSDWNKFDAVLTHFLIFHISARVLNFKPIRLVYGITVVEALISYYMTDTYVFVYVHLSVVFIAALTRIMLFNLWIIIPAGLAMGGAWILSSIGTNKLHGAWHICAAISVYLCIRSIQFTESLLKRRPRKF